MKPKELLLLVIDAYGGSLYGRTLLQKVTYFVCEKLHADLGFRAHYYGPYSADGDKALGELKSLGFVREDALPWGVSERFGELRRFDYKLTPDGETVVADLGRRDPVECERVREIVREIKEHVGSDYRELALAAKTHFIVKRKNRPVELKEIEIEARKLDWSLPASSLEKTVNLLKKLDFVR